MDVRSRNRGAANRSRSNRVVGSISLGRAKARGVRQLLNDTEALKERAGTVMPGPIPALTTSMTKEEAKQHDRYPLERSREISGASSMARFA